MTSATFNSDRSWVSFYIVDVFTRQPLAGNPLSIVINADELDEATMQRIAREFNQSETTFLMRPTRQDADWRLRCFTATGAEVFGAGHNALGAWWWFAESGELILDESPKIFQQEIGNRVLPVEIISDSGRVITVGMMQTPPIFGTKLQDTSILAAALNLSEEDLGVEGLTPQVVSTGAAHLLVPIRNREAVWRSRPDADRLLSVLRALGGQGCYLSCLDPIDSDATAHARFFNPTVGISEDAATGSAAGPLGCYLRANDIVKDCSSIIVEQGHSMERPSRIEVRLQGDQVRVSGACVTVAQGTLRL